MNAAETRASRAIAAWTPLTVVPRSRVTAAIDTFIREVSTTSTNIAIDSRTARRGFQAPSPGTGAAAASPVTGASPCLVRCRCAFVGTPGDGRGGIRFDVKVHDGSPGVLHVPGRARGRMDFWRKWSLPLGTELPIVVDASGWRRVRKGRRMTWISPDGRRLVARTPGPSGQVGC